MPVRYGKDKDGNIYDGNTPMTPPQIMGTLNALHKLTDMYLDQTKEQAAEIERLQTPVDTIEICKLPYQDHPFVHGARDGKDVWLTRDGTWTTDETCDEASIPLRPTIGKCGFVGADVVERLQAENALHRRAFGVLSISMELDKANRLLVGKKLHDGMLSLRDRIEVILADTAEAEEESDG